ncbi:MAG: serine hydrolase [Novosphingobium sp.]
MRNQKLCRLILIILLCLPTAVQADQSADLVQAELTRSKTPGAAIVVIRDGRVERVQGFGQANIEHGVPVHADTLFKTGATGMQFTAAGIMLLVEDGALELDAPVGRYLSGAPSKWRKVTIRQLLNHTSGLPATPNGDFRADYTNAQLLGIIAAQDLNFPAGTRYRFSFAGYIVLGMVIEQVSGEHWTKFVARRLFAPLGMRTARGIDELAIVPNRAAGYEWRGGVLRNAEWISPTANSTADGSLYLSALDYAAWSQVLSRHRLLSSQSWTTLGEPARIADGSSCASVPGWFMGMAGHEPILWQAGSWQGFQSYTLRYTNKDVTVMVFANGDKADVQTLARGLAALADPALAAVPASVRQDADPVVTARARALVEAIAAGRARKADFTDFARLDLKEMNDLNAGMLNELGALQQFEMFDRRTNCSETAYRYRARYDHGMIEVRLGLNEKGKVTNLEIAPLNDWHSPL